MSLVHTTTRLVPLALLGCATLHASAAEIVFNAGNATPARAQAMSEFKSANMKSHFSTHSDGRIGRVYGRAFSHGASAAASVDAFITQHADMWGVDTADLLPEGPFADRRHTQQVYYQPEFEDYKFTATYFTQSLSGLRVYGSKLVLLTRNEESNPLVLASSQLFDLSSFRPDGAVARSVVDHDALVRIAKSEIKGDVQVASTERMIYVGDESNPHAPIIADITLLVVNGFDKVEMISNTATGELISAESMICTIDASGNISALATEGVAADFCEDEVAMPLPYLNVSLQGGGSSITDVDGNYTIPNGGTGIVTIDAELDGQWFNVTNFLGSETSESVTGDPAAALDIVFNAINSSEQVRAEVNAYVEANRIRDIVLQANPSYPLVAGTEMDIFVNRTDGFCPGNAWYDPEFDTINFCLSGSGSPNTAWSSVVHHEYGHHLVSAGGSGQGQYGEGTGDVMSVIILDDPDLGVGFFGSCSSALRSANEGLVYPCSTGSHACAPLYSGCVWDTRELLVVTEPLDYQQLLMSWAVNSILVHAGTEITPQMTIDYLTLDDDDADIGNGTPHYFEIDGGFSAHNMDAPALELVDILPTVVPNFANPNGGTPVAADFVDAAGTLDASTPTLMVDTGSGFQAVAMSSIGGDEFSAAIPGSDCATPIRYYFTAESTNGTPQFLPVDAPDASFQVVSSFDTPVVVFDDNFESDQGWSVSGDSADAGSGRWERAVPTGAGARADAPSDFDGSGQCYITGNGGPGSNTDVDVDETILTSPVMDATGTPVLSYARWFNNAGNTAIDDQFYVQISDNAGSSWSELETLGINHPESNGGWFAVSFNLSEIAGFTLNDQFRIRFIAEDIGAGSIVEAGIDAVRLLSVDCASCPADFTGDGALDIFDVFAFLDAFNIQDPIADFTGDGSFDIFDVFAYLDAFNAGCP
jgi:hypothetical protein